MIRAAIAAILLLTACSETPAGGATEEAEEAAEAANDNATSGVVDDWADQCEERIWFLGQTGK